MAPIAIAKRSRQHNSSLKGRETSRDRAVFMASGCGRLGTAKFSSRSRMYAQKNQDLRPPRAGDVALTYRHGDRHKVCIEMLPRGPEASDCNFQKAGAQLR